MRNEFNFRARLAAWRRSMMRCRLTAVFCLLLGNTPQPPVPLTGIAHVAFRVRDVAKSREFYQRLGYQQAFELHDPGKPPVSYIKINDQQFIELYGGVDDTPPAGLLHLCYETSDMRALVQAFTARGWNSLDARKARAGNMLLLLRDPETRIIEFTQYLPASLHFEDRGKHLGEHRASERLLQATISVQDLTSETNFYVSKLGFDLLARCDGRTLRLPGNSAEAIELEATSPDWKPKLVFEITSLSRTLDALHQAGLAVKTQGDSLSVEDPDGTQLEFVVTRQEARNVL
jgi:catechol 2,3-dioxygenase-like lactoylglutathione lyase family enzyme